MIDLKLAQYKEKKFEEFIELDSFDSEKGQTFNLGKDYVEIYDYDNFCQETYGKKNRFFKLDEKDPLNRFNGLFDGRTYGGGKFVLIGWCGEEWEDSVYIKEMKDYNRKGAILRGGQKEYTFKTESSMWDYAPEIFTLYEHKGNLHENPELYEKIND